MLAASSAFWYAAGAPILSMMGRVVLYDLRGHGKSQVADSGYGVSSMANDLESLIEAGRVIWQLERIHDCLECLSVIQSYRILRVLLHPHPTERAFFFGGQFWNLRSRGHSNSNLGSYPRLYCRVSQTCCFWIEHETACAATSA